MPDAPKHAVIVGGGITGLAAAFALHEQARQARINVRCSVIEPSSQWGGKIVTHHIGDCVVEAGPDSFLSQKPWAIDLCNKLGIADRLINTNEFAKKTFVYSRGRLRELPEGLVVIQPNKLGPFIRSGLLSWAGLARMGLDLVLPAGPDHQEESLAGFFRRRFGRQAFERFLEPLMAGIYAGDAEQISLRATFPRFLDLERQYGSLIRGMLADRSARASGAQQPQRRTMFVTLRDGLGDLVETLVGRIRREGAELVQGQSLEALRLDSGSPSGQPRYELRLSGGRMLSADAVVLTTPAYVSADILRPLSSGAADLLDRIPYASTVTISLIYQASEVAGTISGFGFVVPRREGCDLLAATYTSQKWPHRAPPGLAAVRCYLGGVGREAILALPDMDLIQRVRTELKKITGLDAEPIHTEVNRWDRAMPQYTLGHLDRLGAIQQSLHELPGLFLAGAAYRGIGIPDCIRDGTEAAKSVVGQFAGRVK